MPTTAKTMFAGTIYDPPNRMPEEIVRYKGQFEPIWKFVINQVDRFEPDEDFTDRWWQHKDLFKLHDLVHRALMPRAGHQTGSTP